MIHEVMEKSSHIAFKNVHEPLMFDDKLWAALLARDLCLGKVKEQKRQFWSWTLFDS